MPWKRVICRHFNNLRNLASTPLYCYRSMDTLSTLLSTVRSGDMPPDGQESEGGA